MKNQSWIITQHAPTRNNQGSSLRTQLSEESIVDYHSAPTRINQRSSLRTQLSEVSIMDYHTASTRNNQGSSLRTQLSEESIMDYNSIIKKGLSPITRTEQSGEILWISTNSRTNHKSSLRNL